MLFLEIISRIENILGIYRNHVSFKKFTRILIYLRIILEIFLIIVNAVNYALNVANEINLSIFLFLSATNSITVLLFALYQAVSYEKLIFCFKTFVSYFPLQTYQAEKTEISQKVLLLTFLTYCFLKLLFHLCYLLPPVSFTASYFISHLVLPINLYVCEVRFLCEFHVICYGINAVANQLAVLKEAIEMESGRVISVCEHATVSVSQDCIKRLQQVHKWATAYAVIRKCSELSNSIFGFQIFIMISTTTVYYIILLYSITTMSIQGHLLPILQCIMALFVYMLVLYVLSYAAQQVHNKAESLKQRLAVIVLDSIECEKQYKVTRDLLRQVNTQPIRTKAYGSITVDMSLLPTCIALSTSYAVIALQFNHIL